MSSRYDLLLFDLDNTLIQIPNSYSFFDSIILEVLKRMEILHVPTQSERDQLWRTGKEYVKILNNWGVRDPKAFWFHFDNIDFDRRKNEIMKGKIRPFPDSEPFLKKIKQKKIKTAIITNTILEIAKYTIEHFKLFNYFDEIIALGDTQEICKPEPDGILTIIEKYKFEKKRVAIIGDSIVDVEAGIRAGIEVYKIERHKGLEPASSINQKLEYTKVTSFSELEKYLL